MLRGTVSFLHKKIGLQIGQPINGCLLMGASCTRDFQEWPVHDVL